MKRERAYQGVIIFMVIGFILFFANSHSNYVDLLEVNEDLTNVVGKQITDNESVIKQWKLNFSNLQMEYSELLRENYELESRLGETDIPVYGFTEAEIYLIAQCVEAEAGDYENYAQSQKYVTQVILNRLHSSQFPDRVEEVIYQKKDGIPQFSVAYNGMMDDREVQPETLANVYSVIVHGTKLPEYVLYFYSANVEENWVCTLNTYTECEGTVFAYYSVEDR